MWTKFIDKYIHFHNHSQSRTIGPTWHAKSSFLYFSKSTSPQTLDIHYSAMVSSNTFSLSLILFLSFSSLFSPSQSHKKVSLELYYESLCPYCANFIVNYLPQIFEHDLLSIVDLKLVPWGNAKLRGNSTIVCQVIYMYLRSDLEYKKQNSTPSVFKYKQNLLFRFIHLVNFAYI